MDKPKILKILIICDNPGNVYIEELKKRKIIFQLVDSLKRNLPIEGEIPEIVLLVNRGQAEGLKAKELWPQSQVLLVYGGGKKDFMPYFINIRANLDHDYYNYGSWSEFSGLITRILPPADKNLERLDDGEYELIESESAYVPYSLSNLRLYNFKVALKLSLLYLDWLLDWMAAVSSIRFEQRFYYDTAKRIKTLTIPLTPRQLVHQGRNIFTEDSQLVFTLVDGRTLEAIVKRVSEDGIVASFPSRKSPEMINDIRYFHVNSDNIIINKYKKYCLKVSDEEFGDYPAPIRELMGERMDGQRTRRQQLKLDNTAQKILRDNSQVRALSKIFSSQEHVTAVEGPPGTGKTFLTSLAIVQLLKQGKTVVVTSHSNQGLDNILDQVSGLLTPEREGSLFRLTNNPANVSYDNRRFHRSERYKYLVEEADDGGEEEVEPVEKQLSALEYEDIMKKRNSGEGVVLFVTLNSLILDSTMKDLLDSISVDFGFIDEATKGYLYEMLPLFLAVETKLIMIGDHRQLGNISLPEEAKNELRKKIFSADHDFFFSSREAESEERIKDFTADLDFFSAGFFTTLVKRQLIPSNLLTINRRSLQKIANLVSRVFYGAELISGRFNPFDEGSVKFIDTKSLPDNNESKKGTSFYNPLEARIAVDQFVGRVKQCLAEGGKIQDCVIITPYQAQIREIKKRLRQDLLFNETIKVAKEDLDQLLEELVDTVDAFQGSQRYGVVLSLVRSNPYNDVGFNSDIRRLNVAISRAQDKLTIIGNSSTFLNYYDPDVSSIFSLILKYIKKEGRYLELKVK
jgi:hypothetical protein